MAPGSQKGVGERQREGRLVGGLTWGRGWSQDFAGAYPNIPIGVAGLYLGS